MSAPYSVLEAAALLGIGRTAAYDLLRRGAFPVPAVKVGGLWRIPRRPLDDLLDDGAAGTSPDRADVGGLAERVSRLECVLVDIGRALAPLEGLAAGISLAREGAAS